MAVSLEAKLTMIDNADDDTDWNDGAPNTVVHVEGGGCLENSAGQSYVDIYYDWNATGGSLSGEHLYAWMFAVNAGNLYSRANGGLSIYVQDTSTNWGRFHVGGNDTYNGGWECFVAHCVQHGIDTDGGTPPDLNAVRYVGITYYDDTNIKAGIVNFYLDAIRYGSGIRVQGGTTGDRGTFAEIAAADEASAYGVVIERDGVYFVQGQLDFDDDDADTYFQDSNQMVVFRDLPKVDPDFYRVHFAGANGQTNSIEFTNIFIAASGGADYAVSVSGEYLDTWDMSGCTFQNPKDQFEMVGVDSGHTLDGCNIVAGAEVQPEDATVVSCKFIGPVDRGLRMDQSNNISNCDFQNAPHGVHIPISGEYTFTNLTFDDDCTYDVENSSAGLVDISAQGTSDPASYENTGGGSTNITNEKSYKLTGLPETTKVTWINRYTEVKLYEVVSVGVGGEAEYQYNYVSDTDVDIHILHMSYKYRVMQATLSSINQTIPVTLEEDPVYHNP